MAVPWALSGAFQPLPRPLAASRLWLFWVTLLRHPREGFPVGCPHVWMAWQERLLSPPTLPPAEGAPVAGVLEVGVRWASGVWGSFPPHILLMSVCCCGSQAAFLGPARLFWLSVCLCERSFFPTLNSF